MNFKKPSFILLSIFIIIIVVLYFNYKIPFISSEDKERVVRKIYYADNFSPAHRKMVELFNRKYKGKYKVKPVELPFYKFSTNERKKMLARSLRSKSDRIDVFAVDVIWIPRFAKWCYPLDNSIKNIIETNFLPHLKVISSFKGETVALPVYTDIGMLYYRRDLLEKEGFSEEDFKRLKAGISWTEFLKWGERFSDNNYIYFLFTGDSYEGLMCSFHETLNQAASDEIFTGGMINLNRKPARDGLQFLTDLIHKYKYATEDVYELDESRLRRFALENDVVFLRGWPGFFKSDETIRKYYKKFKFFERAPLPFFNGNKTNAVFGGWNLMISKFSNNKEAALEFLKFAASKEIQKMLHVESGYFPVHKEVYSDQEFINQNPAVTDIKYFLDSGKHRPYMENYSHISDIMAYFFKRALMKKISVEEALIGASDEINVKQVF